MSTFDNPFDPNRPLSSFGCSCGQHASDAEHDAALQLQTINSQSDEKRYEGVVASAVTKVEEGERELSDILIEHAS